MKVADERIFVSRVIQTSLILILITLFLLVQFYNHFILLYSAIPFLLYVSSLMTFIFTSSFYSTENRACKSGFK